jgi:ABC-type microcin C transport system permease subunit YejE
MTINNMWWVLLGELIMFGWMMLFLLVRMIITSIKDYREVKRALKYKIHDEG